MKTLCPKCGLPKQSSGMVGDSSSANTEAQLNITDAHYWESSAGDCDKIRQAVQKKAKLNEAFCKSKGFGSCLEMYHSCSATVACQVLNYWFADGIFTQECGKYGPAIGKFMWGVWSTFGDLFTNPSCFVGIQSPGSCWPTATDMMDQYLGVWDQTVKALEQNYAKALIDAGLSIPNVRRAGGYCIDLDILKSVVMAARVNGVTPSVTAMKPEPLALSKVQPSGIVGSASDTSDASNTIDEAFQPKGSSQFFPPDSSTHCASPGSITIHEALIEFSLWADPDGYQTEAVGGSYTFYRGGSSVQAASDPCTSAIHLLTPEELVQSGQYGAPLVVLGETHPTVKQISMAPTVMIPNYVLSPTPYEMSRMGGMHPFNIRLAPESGSPDMCSKGAGGIWDDVGAACVPAVDDVMQLRLDALKRSVPWIAMAIVGQVARDKQNQGSQAPVGSDAPGGSVVMKVAKGVGTVSVLGLLGYGAWKLWPKLFGV